MLRVNATEHAHQMWYSSSTQQQNSRFDVLNSVHLEKKCFSISLFSFGLRRRERDREMEWERWLIFLYLLYKYRFNGGIFRIHSPKHSHTKTQDKMRKRECDPVCVCVHAASENENKTVKYQFDCTLRNRAPLWLIRHVICTNTQSKPLAWCYSADCSTCTCQ